MDGRRAMVLATAGAVALAAHSLLRQWKRARRAIRLAKHPCKLDLLPSERGAVICMSPPTSTVTYFRGDPRKAEEYLFKRVSAIVHANPWLLAVLDHDESGTMAAYYPPDSSTSACPFEVRKDIALSRAGTSYADMVRALDTALCTTSEKSVGTLTPLWKVALVPDADEPNARFALVVSANHSLLDGHGFYRLHNMLNSASEVQTLQPKRKQEVPDKIMSAMGGEPSLMALMPPGFLIRFLGGQLRNYLFPATRAFGFYVSDDWLAAQKAAHTKGSSGADFVSTNDILVSSFCKLLECDVAIMAINFRGRVSGCGEDDVGNYEDLINYTPADYASPALVRQSISGGVYAGAAQPRAALPTNWQHACSATYGALTNWATFAKPLSLNGAEQELHVPLFDFNASTPAQIFGAMVVFRPCSGRVGVLVAGKAELIKAVNASGMAGSALEIKM